MIALGYIILLYINIVTWWLKARIVEQLEAVIARQWHS
jgi:hypothetical protein